MQGILLATAVAIVVALFGTPVLIKVLTRIGVGQQVRLDGPTTHLVKQGERHRIANTGTEPLVIVELQMGRPDELDIERLADDYQLQ